MRQDSQTLVMDFGFTNELTPAPDLAGVVPLPELDLNTMQDSMENAGWMQPCQECAKLKKEIEKLKKEHALDFDILKQKMESTDMLIKKFKEKSKELEIQNKKTKEMKKQMDKANREAQTVQLQLQQTLQEVEPLKKSKAALERQKQMTEVNMQNLQDKLHAAEAVVQQYKDSTESMELKFTESSAKQKQNAKEISSLKASQKKQDLLVKKLQDECRSKKSELGEKTKEITALKKRLSMTEAQYEKSIKSTPTGQSKARTRKQEICSEIFETCGIGNSPPISTAGDLINSWMSSQLFDEDLGALTSRNAAMLQPPLHTQMQNMNVDKAAYLNRRKSSPLKSSTQGVSTVKVTPLDGRTVKGSPQGGSTAKVTPQGARNVNDLLQGGSNVNSSCSSTEKAVPQGGSTRMHHRRSSVTEVLNDCGFAEAELAFLDDFLSPMIRALSPLPESPFEAKDAGGESDSSVSCGGSEGEDDLDMDDYADLLESQLQGSSPAKSPAPARSPAVNVGETASPEKVHVPEASGTAGVGDAVPEQASSDEIKSPPRPRRVAQLNPKVRSDPVVRKPRVQHAPRSQQKPQMVTPPATPPPEPQMDSAADPPPLVNLSVAVVQSLSDSEEEEAGGDSPMLELPFQSFSSSSSLTIPVKQIKKRRGSLASSLPRRGSEPFLLSAYNETVVNGKDVSSSSDSETENATKVSSLKKDTTKDSTNEKSFGLLCVPSVVDIGNDDSKSRNSDDVKPDDQPIKCVNTSIKNNISDMKSESLRSTKVIGDVINDVDRLKPDLQLQKIPLVKDSEKSLNLQEQQQKIDNNNDKCSKSFAHIQEFLSESMPSLTENDNCADKSKDQKCSKSFQITSSPMTTRRRTRSMCTLSVNNVATEKKKTTEYFLNRSFSVPDKSNDDSSDEEFSSPFRSLNKRRRHKFSPRKRAICSSDEENVSALIITKKCLRSHSSSGTELKDSSMNDNVNQKTNAVDSKLETSTGKVTDHPKCAGINHELITDHLTDDDDRLGSLFLSPSSNNSLSSVEDLGDITNETNSGEKDIKTTKPLLYIKDSKETSTKSDNHLMENVLDTNNSPGQTKMDNPPLVCSNQSPLLCLNQENSLAQNIKRTSCTDYIPECLNLPPGGPSVVKPEIVNKDKVKPCPEQHSSQDSAHVHSSLNSSDATSGKSSDGKSIHMNGFETHEPAVETENETVSQADVAIPNHDSGNHDENRLMSDDHNDDGICINRDAVESRSTCKSQSCSSVLSLKIQHHANDVLAQNHVSEHLILPHQEENKKNSEKNCELVTKISENVNNLKDKILNVFKSDSKMETDNETNHDTCNEMIKENHEPQQLQHNMNGCPSLNTHPPDQSKLDQSLVGDKMERPSISSLAQQLVYVPSTNHNSCVFSELPGIIRASQSAITVVSPEMSGIPATVSSASASVCSTMSPTLSPSSSSDLSTVLSPLSSLPPSLFEEQSRDTILSSLPPSPIMDTDPPAPLSPLSLSPFKDIGAPISPLPPSPRRMTPSGYSSSSGEMAPLSPLHLTPCHHPPQMSPKEFHDKAPKTALFVHPKLPSAAVKKNLNAELEPSSEGGRVNRKTRVPSGRRRKSSADVQTSGPSEGVDLVMEDLNREKISPQQAAVNILKASVRRRHISAGEGANIATDAKQVSKDAKQINQLVKQVSANGRDVIADTEVCLEHQQTRKARKSGGRKRKSPTVEGSAAAKKQAVEEKKMDEPVLSIRARVVHVKNADREIGSLLKQSSVMARDVADRLTNPANPVPVAIIVERIVKVLQNADCDLLTLMYTECAAHKPINKPFFSEVEGHLMQLIRSLLKKPSMVSMADSLRNAIICAINKKDGVWILAKLSLTRVLTGLCRHLGDVFCVRSLLYDMLYKQTPGCHSIVLAAVGVWPHVLEAPTGCCGLQHVMLFAVHKKMTQHPSAAHKMKTCLQTLCGSQAAILDNKQLTTELIERLQAADLKNTNAVVFETSKALELLAVTEGWQWTNNHLIRESLWPRLHQWGSSQGQVSDTMVTAILNVLGRVSYHCPAENASSVQEMMKTLSALLNTPQPSTEQATCVNKVAGSVQQSALSSLILLSPFSPHIVATAIHKYTSLNAGNVPCNVQEKIEVFWMLFKDKLPYS